MRTKENIKATWVNAKASSCDVQEIHVFSDGKPRYETGISTTQRILINCCRFVKKKTIALLKCLASGKRPANCECKMNLNDCIIGFREGYHVEFTAR